LWLQPTQYLACEDATKRTKTTTPAAKRLNVAPHLSRYCLRIGGQAAGAAIEPKTSKNLPTDRLARSVPHLCEIGARLEAKGVSLKVLDQAEDAAIRLHRSRRGTNRGAGSEPISPISHSPLPLSTGRRLDRRELSQWFTAEWALFFALMLAHQFFDFDSAFAHR
jgi:hypothetical protein